AVLFARRDSIYKTLPGCEVYDQDRDALSYVGGMPVVAHPPCRAWGNLAHFAKPRDGEKQFAEWAVQQVRRWGGVLEHPKNSRLWAAKGLPKAGSGRPADRRRHALHHAPQQNDLTKRMAATTADMGTRSDTARLCRMAGERGATLWG